MKKERSIISFIISASVLFIILILAGCAEQAQPQLVCNTPYILVGTSCCLDTNDNSICDSDEPAVEPVSDVTLPDVVPDAGIAAGEAADEAGSEETTSSEERTSADSTQINVRGETSTEKTYPGCGDGTCRVNENCNTCSKDCGCTGSAICQQFVNTSYSCTKTVASSDDFRTWLADSAGKEIGSTSTSKAGKSVELRVYSQNTGKVQLACEFWAMKDRKLQKSAKYSLSPYETSFQVYQEMPRSFIVDGSERTYTYMFITRCATMTKGMDSTMYMTHSTTILPE